MEQYYFIEKNGTKQGPYKLDVLKEQTIYFDELIWRSDSDQWKKASDYEELSGIYIIKPPPTPKEKKVAEVNEKFTSQIAGWLIAIYVLSSLLIGIISFSIAQSSWESYNLKHPIQSSVTPYEKLNGGSIPRSLAELSSERYDSFVPGNYNNEDAYGLGQSFWFRPFSAFGGTVYLTIKEQNDSNALLINLIMSSFASLSFIFVAIGLIYYAMKRNAQEDEPINA